jgi:Rieske Fe-S protein
LEPHRGDNETPELPRPTIWPVGFAIGIACLLVGLVVSWPAVAVGGGITILFGFLWARDVMAARRATPPPTGAEAPAVLGRPAPPIPAHRGEAAMPKPAPGERFPRSRFLEASTLGLGAVIGGAVTVPALGFAILPPFLHQGSKDIDIGPLSDYPEGEWMIVHFFIDPKEGEVTRRVAYIRYNGELDGQPSFTAISNRCAHLGCPVQPNGLAQANKTKDVKAGSTVVQLTPVQGLSGFGCPCHGGAYDTEGNRTAGPPVRGLDRYRFSIRHGRLYLGGRYSVKTVSGTGADAKIKSYPASSPGNHVGDWEAWLYPVQAPH